MRKTIIIIITFLFALSSSLYAVDRVKKNNDSSKAQNTEKAKKNEKANYQDFTDKNNNGIDDKIEKRQKETTRLEPKREPEVQKREQKQAGAKYVPKEQKTKQPANKQPKPQSSGSQNTKNEKK